MSQWLSRIFIRISRWTAEIVFYSVRKTALVFEAKYQKKKMDGAYTFVAQNLHLSVLRVIVHSLKVIHLQGLHQSLFTGMTFSEKKKKKPVSKGWVG